MSQYTHYLTLELGNSSLEVEVEFDAQPGEPMVMYYPDGSGYPGSPPTSELLSAHVTDWSVSDDERERDLAPVWETLDVLAEAHLRDRWDEFGNDCLESITEHDDDRY